jgi:hypothetical protein
MNELKRELEEEENHVGMHARIVIFKDASKEVDLGINNCNGIVRSKYSDTPP